MTTPTGPYHVVRHWTRWTVEYALDSTRQFPIHTDRSAAQADADQRNTQYANTNKPRPPKPAQPDLFNQQEATS